MTRMYVAVAAILFALATQPALAQSEIMEQDNCAGGAGAQKFGGPYVVRFDVDSTKVIPAHRSELELAAKTIEGQRPALVCLIGSTDKTGSIEYNRKLALRRAHAVGQELIKLGVQPDRLKVITFTQTGEGKATSAVLGEDRPSERRVTIRLAR